VRNNAACVCVSTRLLAFSMSRGMGILKDQISPLARR
jgi:hypothetical protein